MSSNIDQVKNSMKQSKLSLGNTSQPSMQSEAKTNEVEEVKQVSEKQKDVKTDAQIYSKLITTGKVEKFDWSYEEKLWNPTKGKFDRQKINLEDVEAIYINPKWKKSKVGDFLTFN